MMLQRPHWLGVVVAVASNGEEIHYPGVDRQKRFGKIRIPLGQFADSGHFEGAIIDKNRTSIPTGSDQRLGERLRRIVP